MQSNEHSRTKPTALVNFHSTNRLFESLHFGLFGHLEKDHLATKDAVFNYMDSEGYDRIHGPLVGDETPYNVGFNDFKNEVINNFQALREIDTRAIQLATILKEKAGNLVAERNHFVERIALLWCKTTQDIIKMAECKPDVYIAEMKMEDRRQDEPGRSSEYYYPFQNGVFLAVAAIKETVSFCQDYIDLYSLSAKPARDNNVSSQSISNPIENQFIVAFRESMRNLANIDHDEWLKLNKMQYQLIDDIERTITTHPDIGKALLKRHLGECLNEQPHAETACKAYQKRLEEAGLDAYSSNLESVREAYCEIENAIGSMVEHMVRYFPNSIDKLVASTYHTYKIADLFERFVNRWSPLRKEVAHKRKQANSDNNELIPHLEKAKSSMKEFTFDKLILVENLLKKSSNGLKYLIAEYDTANHSKESFAPYIQCTEETLNRLKYLHSDNLIEAFESELRVTYLTQSNPDSLINYLEMIGDKIFDVNEQLLEYHDLYICGEIDNFKWVEKDCKLFDELFKIAKHCAESRANYYSDSYFSDIDRLIEQYTHAHTKNREFTNEEIISVYGDDGSFKDKSVSTHIGTIKQHSIPVYSTFFDLFINPDEFDICIDALRKFRPEKPVVNDSGHWIGGKRDNSKTILVGWVDRLEHLRKIAKLDNRRHLARLLENHFTGLKFGKDARIFYDLVDETIRLGFVATLPR